MSAKAKRVPAAPDLIDRGDDDTRMTRTVDELEAMFGSHKPTVGGGQEQLMSKVFGTQAAPFKEATEKPRLFKNKLFILSRQADCDLFNELLNNKKYNIHSFEKNWGPDGAFRVWVLYSEENLTK